MTKHTIDLHTPEFQRTFLEMMLLEELTETYNAEAIETLVTRGETRFPDDPFFPAMRAYPLIREGEFDQAKQQLDAASALGDHYLIHCLLGALSDDAGFTFEAEQHYLRAIERFPNVPMTQRAIAIHYFHRKFYGEAGLHLMHYVRLTGFNEETVPMLLDFFQVYDEIPLEMNDELLKAAIGYLNANPRNPHAHSLYASICSHRVDMLVKGKPDQDTLDDETIHMLLEVEEHGMWSATYDDSEDQMFRAMFADYVDNVILPNTSKFYVYRLRLRYWYHRLTHRVTGGYADSSMR
ncbi:MULTISPECIES: tetratricopeptide repeat protein [Exiguobacterium]|uniref:Tetratricopeptide repeat protein n=2 Tax=Exiguobacterium TaxID=33986 RepID=A0A377FS66_9BACL|nr:MULTISPECIES: hypothetical protein [Exiguobacterium]MCT4794768.1 hypothetical protein [Exiguobacterium alkaliphilum]STO07326.1 Uncharacterised protein [Exiguobacterium aurantiacum]